MARCAARTLRRPCAVVLVLPVLPQSAKHAPSAVISLLRVNYVILSGFVWRLRSGQSIAPRVLLLCSGALFTYMVPVLERTRTPLE